MATWKGDLLGYLGAPYNAVSVTALTYWARSEGIPATANAWLATSNKTPGWYPPPPPFDEPWYHTEAEGVAAIGNNLLTGKYGYGAVVSAFRNSGTLEQIWAAVNASTWCRGCSTGKYPKVLYENLTKPVTLTQRIQPIAVTYGKPPVTWDQTYVNDVWTALANWVNIFAQTVQNEIFEAQNIFNSI